LNKVIILCDGSSRGNPGPAGIGFIIKDPGGKVIEKRSEFIGIKTNNQAEYLAAIKATERAVELGAEEAVMYVDSQLLTKQVRGEYRVRDRGLQALHSELSKLLRQLESFKIKHVPRSKNAEADKLANLAVDKWMKGKKVVKFSLEAAKFAGEIVRKGGVIAFPTDTLYGLGCDPMNSKAVKRISEIKRRWDKPFPVLVDGLEEALRLGEFDEKIIKLASMVWPGQVTIVVRSSPEFRDSPVLFGRDKVGLRIPASVYALEIIRRAGGKLVGTSANISGHPPPRAIDEIEGSVAESVDLIIDGGLSPVGEASTVIEVDGDKIKLLREGAVKAEKLRRLAGELGLSFEV